MRRPLSLLCALIALAVWPVAAQAAGPSPPAEAAPTKVVVLNVQGAIDGPLLSFLDQQLDVAQSEGAIVVLQLNTSGTLDQDGVALGDRLVAMRVPVLAWVGPAPAKAAGAGLLLMYASSIAGVSPGSQTGPQNPVDLAHPDLTYPGLASTIRGWIAARRKSTRTDWVDRPLPAATAISYGIAQVPATSVPDLLHRVDGRTVQTAAGPVVLHTTIATSAGEHSVDVTFDNLGPVKRVEHGVASPSIIYFLLVLSLACMAFELTQPGFGFAGFAGLGMLALAAFGITEIPPTWLGLALLVGGVGLMTLDVRIRKLGVLTAIGLVAFVVGSWLAWDHVAHAIRISPWLIGGATVASLLYLRVRAHRGAPVAGPDRQHPAGFDRAGRRGPRTAGARRPRLRQGRHVARPHRRGRHRPRHPRPGPRRRRPRPQGRAPNPPPPGRETPTGPVRVAVP